MHKAAKSDKGFGFNVNNTIGRFATHENQFLKKKKRMILINYNCCYFCKLSLATDWFIWLIVLLQHTTDKYMDV